MKTLNKLEAIKYLTDTVDHDTSEIIKARMLNEVVKIIRSFDFESTKEYLDSRLYEIHHGKF